jgi:two-component system, sporulation sensor kinase E
MTISERPSSAHLKFAAAYDRVAQYGVDPNRLPSFPPVSAVELKMRIMQSRELLESALPFVDHLYNTVESECVVAICDADGILLVTRGERLPDRLLQQHTTPGICWTEHTFGVNALGTALAEDHAVHIVGEEHYLVDLNGMSCAATPLHDESGKIVGALAIAGYMTEHSPYMLGTVLSIGHAIEKAMMLKSEHYRTLLMQKKIVETSNNLIVIADREGAILHINDLAQQLLVPVEAQYLSDVFDDKSVATVALTERRDIVDFYGTMKHQHTGAEHHIFWDAHWVEAPLSNQSTLLLVGRDMTRYVRLERTTKQAERLSTMGKFAAQIAHEIRNPVAVIKLAMQLMLNQEEFSEKSQKKGEMILSELRRIEDLVNHFLQISKPQTPQIGNCNIVKLLSDTTSLMQSVFLEANLRLIEEYEDVGVIRADCDQLHQVFLNLLRNSIDATPAGGSVKVVVKRDEEEQDLIVIQVIDTGHGIPEDCLADVFEAFYTTKSKGTGLGLSNAKSIIEAHGGDMEVESSIDDGTRISIWLPVTPPTVS